MGDFHPFCERKVTCYAILSMSIIWAFYMEFYMARTAFHLPGEVWISFKINFACRAGEAVPPLCVVWSLAFLLFVFCKLYGVRWIRMELASAAASKILSSALSDAVESFECHWFVMMLNFTLLRLGKN